MWSGGLFYVDAVRAGASEYVEYSYSNGSFESGLTDWTKKGTVQTYAALESLNNESYYGNKHLRLVRPSQFSPYAHVRQALSLVDDPAEPSDQRPKHTFVPEACVWVRFADDVIAGSGPLSLQIRIRNALNQFAILTEQSITPTANEVDGSWVFLHTTQVSPPSIPFELNNSVVTKLEVRILSQVQGTVWVDFVQVGERYGVNGNPDKYVTAIHQPRYRSEILTDDGTTYHPVRQMPTVYDGDPCAGNGGTETVYDGWPVHMLPESRKRFIYAHWGSIKWDILCDYNQMNVPSWAPPGVNCSQYPEDFFRHDSTLR